MTPKCYNGKVLHINLNDQTHWVENPPGAFYRKYGGGSAMGLYYILKGMDPRVDALSPENIMTIFTGVPTGLPIAGLSRITINAKSPLTGAIGDSQAGGFLPERMKASGFDGIVISGRAISPVYLWINNGVVEFRDASHLWGKITGDAEDLIKMELGDSKVEVLQIGPGGENGVRFAAVMNMNNRANGRTGMGDGDGIQELKGSRFSREPKDDCPRTQRSLPPCSGQGQSRSRTTQSLRASICMGQLGMCLPSRRSAACQLATSTKASLNLQMKSAVKELRKQF